jgi:quercetin dioxygenase-like cupin family protein
VSHTGEEAPGRPLIVRSETIEWQPFAPGSRSMVKRLRVSRETGWLHALMRGAAGQVNRPHTHLGAASFFVLEGGFDFRGGSAIAGDWVWEPVGAVHEATTHHVDTLYIATAHGPVKYLTDEEVSASGSDAIGGALVRTTELNWTADGHGNEVKVLRTNPETGFMHLLVKARAGQTNSPRSFLGPAEIYILEGAIDINGSTVRAGDWIWQPAGSDHAESSHPADTVYLANFYGPTAFRRADGSISTVMDWRSLQSMGSHN